MTMYDFLDEFLNDEEVILNDMMDRMIDEMHTSISENKYAHAASVSHSIRKIEHSLGV